MRLELLAALNAERAARRPCVLVTDVSSGAQRLVRAGEVSSDPLAPALARALATGQSGLVPAEQAGAPARLFLTVDVPSPRLVMIGAVHISQALAPMARLAGFRSVIVDPRTAFATPERFPDVEVIPEWPDTALPVLSLDRFTALATLTHDPRIDEPGLVAALAAGCFYVGALGSRRTHQQRLERLALAGVAAQDLARIRAPIGLGIGATTPAEIAVAVLAEVISARRAMQADGEAIAGAAA